MSTPLANQLLDTHSSESTNSLHLLNYGSADDFIAVLKEEVSRHPAIHHPLLSRLGNGEFSNVQAVLRDYANQYSFYTSWFTQYLDGVIANMKSESHRNRLQENVEDEYGDPNSPTLEERPHTEIFDIFKKSVGADEEFCQSNPPCTTVLLWRDLFLQKCNSSIEGVGISALGLGTEYIISMIYPYFISAIENHTGLNSDASLFFRLHVECDDDHANSIIEIIKEIAEETSTREAIRFGVFSSLNLRRTFWDTQLARAETLD